MPGRAARARHRKCRVRRKPQLRSGAGVVAMIVNYSHGTVLGACQLTHAGPFQGDSFACRDGPLRVVLQGFCSSTCSEYFLGRATGNPIDAPAGAAIGRTALWGPRLVMYSEGRSGRGGPLN